MIEAGDSGIDRDLLRAFAKLLPDLEPAGVFRDRFTLQLRTRGTCFHFHVDRSRRVVRPVVAEDSRKTLVSVSLSRFEELVRSGDRERWRRAVENGTIEIG